MVRPRGFAFANQVKKAEYRNISEKKPVVKIANNGISEGKRNTTLFKLACSFRAKGLSPDATLKALEIENPKKCSPPLSNHEIQQIVYSAYNYGNETIVEIRINATDLGNARRLVNLYRGNIHYCFAWKKWLVWGGKSWHIDNNGQILRLAKEGLRLLLTKAGGKRLQSGQ